MDFARRTGAGTVKSWIKLLGRVAIWAVTSTMFFAAFVAARTPAQNAPYERAFPQSKAAVEKALAAMPGNLAGHLPVLDGFANPGEHPLDRYQRAYYQSKVQVTSTPSGGSLVRVSTKVTAWYADPAGSRSGYQLLTSNGRLESDLLDQLADQLAKGSTESSNRTASASSPQPSTEPAAAEPTISAPAPKFPDMDRTFSSSVSQGLSAQERARASAPQKVEKSDSALQAEAESLEETLDRKST